MSDLRKAAKQALNALEAMMAEFKALDLPYGSKAYALAKDARLGLRAALTEPVQEPVAWRAVGGSIWGHKGSEDDTPLYEHPPTDLLKQTQAVLRNVSGVEPIGNDDDYCESAWAQHRSVLKDIEKWLGESNEQ